MTSSSKWSNYVISILIVGAVAVFIGRMPVREQAQNLSDSEAGVTTNAIAKVTYSGQDGKNVLELLDAAHDVELQKSDLGAFVVSIDGVGGDANTYWLYYVNGEAATVAADQFVTKDGDTIEWRYERF